MTGRTTIASPASLSAWLLAARPATLPAAVTPVLVGTATAVREGSFRPPVFGAALAVALLLQIGANFANDLADFERGADTAGRLGPPRATQSRLLTPAQMRWGTALVLAAAGLVGIYLVMVGGWPVLVLGIAAIVAGLLYTWGPWPYGYHGLGDLFVFLFFGLVAVIGTHYLHTDGVSSLAVLAALPVGLTVTAVLAVNNLRDVETDRRAGKRTLAVRLGARATRWYYAALVFTPYALLALLPTAGGGPWAWLPVASLPLALTLAWTVLTGTEGRALNRVLARTAQLHLAFGALLALAFLL